MRPFFIVVAIIFGTAISGLTVWHWSEIKNGEVCEKSEYTQQKDCARYSVLPYLTIKVSKSLDDHAGAIGAIATIFIAWFTIGLAISTQRLWEEAIKAKEIAAATAQAARDSVEIARSALISGERAFVFPTGNLSCYWDLVPGTTFYNWRFRVELKNSGNTPTKNMKMHTRCGLFDAPLPNGFDFDYQTDNIGNGLIPPNSIIFGGIAPHPQEPAITKDDILELYAGHKWLYIFGWIRYFDVFPGTPERITRYCWLIVPGGDPTTFVPDSKSRAEQLVFPSIHHHEGNCADDECA